MNSRGQIIVEVGMSGKGRSMMVLRPRMPRTSNQNKFYTIDEDDGEAIWKLSRDHNPEFEAEIAALCHALFEIFDLGTPNVHDMADLGSAIEDHIDDLIYAAPREEKDMPFSRPAIVGGGTVIATNPRDGRQETIDVEVTESGLLIARQ